VGGQLSLPTDDEAYLTERKFSYSVQVEANMTCVVLKDFALPNGYEPDSSDLLLRLSPGYPDVPPDMWWFSPPVRLRQGPSIPATEQMENHLGRSWQRWSRHFNAGQWRSGVDSLESFIALIRKDLQKYAPELVQ
jgi:hypothetical protein